MGINNVEYGALKPGLDLLANRLATARLGSFPNRHAWHRIDFLAANIYRDRAYDESIAQTMIEVRAKLWDFSHSRRIYLNFIEISTLAFALRQLHKADPGVTKADSRDIVQALAKKLEKYRKRAKRSAIAPQGKQGYDDAAARWGGFRDWAQFNLLYSNLPRRGTPFIKQSWRAKRGQMAELIKVTVKERYDLGLTEADVNKIRDLVIPSLRRGRHELTLNTVLEGSDAAKDFLIAFMTKRLDLKKGPSAPRSQWERYFERSAVIAEAMKRPFPNPIHSWSLPSNDMDISGSCNPVHMVAGRPAMAEKSQSLNVLTDQQIILAISTWFIESVDAGYRQAVCDEARHQVVRYPEHYSRTLISKSLRDLIEEARPAIDSSQWCDYVNAHVDWLLNWMLALRSNPHFVFGAIGRGYTQANKPAA
jgi:hypothetical protein